MHNPLVNLRLVESQDAPFLIAKALTEAGIRVTAPHAHARGQLFGSTRGLLSVGTQDGQWVVPAIHAVWIPPRHVHSLRSHGAFAGWSAYVAEDMCADLPGQPCTMRTSGLLREAITRATSWTTGPLSEPDARVAQLILDEVRTLPRERFGLPMPRDPRLLRIARELADHPEDKRSLDEWAAWAAVTPRTLTRKFVAETGCSFGAWRQRARLMRALEMLAAGTPVTAIALDLGYQNISAFIAMFRRSFGVTPTRFFDSRNEPTA